MTSMIVEASLALTTPPVMIVLILMNVSALPASTALRATMTSMSVNLLFANMEVCKTHRYQ